MSLIPFTCPTCSKVIHAEPSATLWCSHGSCDSRPTSRMVPTEALEGARA